MFCVKCDNCGIEKEAYFNRDGEARLPFGYGWVQSGRYVFHKKHFCSVKCGIEGGLTHLISDHLEPGVSLRDQKEAREYKDKLAGAGI